MLKHTLFGLLAAAASFTALAETQCVPHPQNERIDPLKFQARLQKQGYEIKKFKITKGNCYEIYGKNKEGQKVEIYFDTKTGQPVKTEIDD